MKVYVAEIIFPYEGGDVLGAATTPLGAMKVAEERAGKPLVWTETQQAGNWQGRYADDITYNDYYFVSELDLIEED